MKDESGSAERADPKKLVQIVVSKTKFKMPHVSSLNLPTRLLPHSLPANAISRSPIPKVGATNGNPPSNFTIDHNRIQLGTGGETYNRAIEALKQWRQFDLGWVSIVPGNVPLKLGATVAVKARAVGFWSLNAARIVYLINEKRRFGFAYGTLPDHVECGEERFTIEWNEDDTVWYDILAFSKPRHPLVRLSFPLARMLQKRFARGSKAKMVDEVKKSMR